MDLEWNYEALCPYICRYDIGATLILLLMDIIAIKVMSEVKIDISDQFSKTINELEDKDFDYVFTLCSDAEENCPVYSKERPYTKVLKILLSSQKI